MHRRKRYDQTVKAAFVVAAAVVLASVAGAGLYLAGVKHLHWHVIRPLLGPAFVRAYLVDPRLRRLIDVMNDEEAGRSDSFEVFWRADRTELISKRLFRPVEMYGVRRYMYKPGVRTLQFVTGAAGVYRAMEMEDSPALRQALASLDTRRLAEASYDRLGFRHVDAELARDCATRVLFLGDSFTDGVGVNDGEAFVNVYGHLVRDRLHVSACPINAGVEGYGSLEESYVLDTYFEAFGRPPVIVVMHYANDVDDDEDAVIRGAVAETDPRWTASLTYLARIAAAARAAGATLLIAAVPPSQQFMAPASRRNYQDVLRRFCDQQGVRFIDLFDPIGRFGPRSAYFEDDPHWTPGGHRAVAEALLESTRDVIVR
jgi:lysophospholipase L1-like esterase